MTRSGPFADLRLSTSALAIADAAPASICTNATAFLANGLSNSKRGLSSDEVKTSYFQRAGGVGVMSENSAEMALGAG
jgi:hypothetical protein